MDMGRRALFLMFEFSLIVIIWHDCSCVASYAKTVGSRKLNSRYSILSGVSGSVVPFLFD